MPKVKKIPPLPSRHTGQRSLDEPLYLIRPFFSNWTHPTWVTSEVWRRVVESQQVCLICRETLIGNILSLDWTIEPRDSTQRDELKDQIDYYTRFFENTGDYDFSELIEWITTDLLDLPFGGACEVGRAGDSEDGKVLWVELLDGGTLYPTLNRDYPIGQYVPEAGLSPVYFPKHSINRVYMSPRTEIKRKGWGVAPPEKIWIALNLLSSGDTYYAKLLLDTPEAGILDLIDMDRESAIEWVEGWKKLLTGIDSQKIPVLYEHTTPAEWIPFTRNPSDIQFDSAIGRYTSIVASGYGMAPSDIGLGAAQNGGNTLAGTLRDERRSKRNGYARLKRKLESWFNRMLPSQLRFKFIDMDDELVVALGRARLANATAWSALVTANLFTEEEARNQTIKDGMLSISVPEKLPPELQQRIDAKQERLLNPPQPFGGNNNNAPGKKPAERPSMLGRPVSPSSGGWGETTARSVVSDDWISTIVNADDQHFQRLAYTAYPGVSSDAFGIWNALEDHTQIRDWITQHDEALWTGDGGNDLPELSQIVLSAIKPQLVAEVRAMDWWQQHNVPTIVQQFVEQSLLIAEQQQRILESRAYVEHFDPPVITLDRSDLEERIGNHIRSLFDYVPEFIANAVISATRDFVLEARPDDGMQSVYDPRLLSLIRDRLSTALYALQDVFMQNTSGIIIAEFEKGASNND